VPDGDADDLGLVAAKVKAVIFGTLKRRREAAAIGS
jgi:hypothetical protein